MGDLVNELDKWTTVHRKIEPSGVALTRGEIKEQRRLAWEALSPRQNPAGETAEQKLRRERDRLAQRIAERDDEIRRQCEMREATERQLSATRGVVTRIKNRVGHGVCPCCNRTFGDLYRHMSTKHPGYAAEAAE